MSLWRNSMDSSHLVQPRVLVRVYVAPGEMDDAIEFYEKVLGVDCDMYLSIPPVPAEPSAGFVFSSCRQSSPSAAAAALRSSAKYPMSSLMDTPGRSG